MSKVLKGEFRMQNRVSHVARSLMLSTLTCFLFLGLLGCEDKDTNAVAKAQECLDKAREAADAAACRGLIEGKSSQQAYIVRCSIEFVAGGLTTQKVIDAFKAEKTGSESKEAKLISLLSLGGTNPTATADNAAAYCKLSGIPGLIYLANLSVIGTYLNPSVNTDLSTYLNDCANGIGSCSDAAIGTAVISIADSYCTDANSSSDVCAKINTAITEANGSPEDIAKKFYAELNKTSP